MRVDVTDAMFPVFEKILWSVRCPDGCSLPKSHQAIDVITVGAWSGMVAPFASRLLWPIVCKAIGTGTGSEPVLSHFTSQVP